MNKITLIALSIASIFTINKLCNAQCHIDDWTALKALYESTDGDNWDTRFGWDIQIANQSSPPANCNLENLYGVDLNEHDRVDYLGPANNSLNGSIPAEVGLLSHLKKLYLLNDSLIIGNIPPEIGNLSMLTELKLYGNGLTGNIPSEINTLNNLTILWLFDNQLEGDIPAPLGNLTLLTQLKIYGNYFTGTIPTELSNLSNLVELLLNGNLLIGDIPKELGNLSNLTRLSVGNNNLSGCYHNNLTVFCNQLAHPLFNESTSISAGNNFDTSWEDFCATNEGVCPPNGIDTLSVATNYSGSVKVSATLTANDQYILQNNNTKIIDYTTCNGNNNTNCKAISGFNNYAANEVLWATEKAYDYFLNKHNFDLKFLNSYVNSNYVEFPNHAIYNSSNKAIYYGTGDGILRTSMTSPDIVGHEVTHHLINTISQLSNYGESGALQESFADIFGEMIENYCYDSNDWIIGSQVVTPDADHTGIRNLANPADTNMKNPQPVFYRSENYWIVQNEECYFDDLCGIHINNGVQNYWFYLLSEGGSGINEIGDTYNIIGIGKEKAARITFENLKNISINTEAVTPHYQAMYGAIEAAKTLFGENSNEVIQTRNAWRAVGLYETQTNPVKWKIANEKRDFSRPIIESGDTTFIPMLFELVIDSLNQDLTADKLSINLQLPNQLVIDNVTALAPLSQTELTVEHGSGETDISINRQNNQTAKMELAPKIKSGKPILVVGVCIVSIDLPVEDLDLQIGISGGTTVSNSLVQFKSVELPLGFDNNNFDIDVNYLLNLAVGVNQKTCSTLGWLDIDVLNGFPPFVYTLKNSAGIIIDEGIKNDTQYQFYNLSENDYELHISEEAGQRRISKKFTISHYANINGSECCPENLVIPPGQFNGLFTAGEDVEIKQGSTLSSGEISICKE